MAAAGLCHLSRFRRLVLSLLGALALVWLWANRVGPRRIAAAMRAPWHARAAATAVRGARGAAAFGPPPGAASLVWVMLGDSHFQPYLLESIRQARIFNRNEYFFLVVDSRHFNNSHPWIPALDKMQVRGR